MRYSCCSKNVYLSSAVCLDENKTAKIKASVYALSHTIVSISLE